MPVTATELKMNLGKYLLLAATQDVLISKNGKIIAKLCSPYKKKMELVDSLIGIMPATMTLEEAKRERLDEV